MTPLRRLHRAARRAVRAAGERFPRGDRIRFFVNLGVGFVIAILLHAAEHTDAGEAALNAVSDRLLRIEARWSPPVPEPPVVFVDIDEATHVEWGRPLLTPRAKLAEWVDAAARNHASVVVLDILLEHPDPGDAAGDFRLRSVLEELRRRRATTRVVVPVRLARGEAVPTIVDDLLDGQTVFGAVPNGGATESDGVIRYWRPWERSGAAGDRRVVWGVPLLAAALARGDAATLAAAGVELERGGSAGHARVHETVIAGRRVAIPSDREDLFLQRLRFTVIPGENALGLVRSARYFVEPADPEGRAAFRAFLEGRVVVIGGSTPELGDVQRTPVGEMAGMYILGNAIATVLEGRQVRPLPTWAMYGVEAAILLFSAAVFLRWRSVRSTLVASAVLLAALLPLTVHQFFRHGILLNAVFPVVGMGLHQLFTELEHWLLRGRDDAAPHAT